MICPYPKTVPLKAKQGVFNYTKVKTEFEKPGYVQVRCGKCTYCQSIVKLQWVWRMEQETRFYDPYTVAFSTLTYNDNHATGTLQYKHVQHMLREYRRKTGESFRYFAVGEYGSKSGREHFHVLTWGVKDLARLHSFWNRGFTHPRYYDETPPVSQGHFNYVVNYLDKPMWAQLKFENPEWEGVQEMRHMSQGIGRGYELTTEQKEEYYMTGQIMVSTERNYKIPIPKYWTQPLYDAMDEKGKALMTQMKLEAANKEKKKLIAKLESQGVTLDQYYKRLQWHEKHLRRKKRHREPQVR